jgi:hypothetical protein
MKLREGTPVVFSLYGKNQIGIIESARTINKMKRYKVRAESGKITPYLGINTEAPGRILVDLSEKYFKDMPIDEEMLDIDNED